MRLFSFFKKSSHQSILDPYKNNSLNQLYNLLFCDDLDLFKANHSDTSSYPFNILFSESSSEDALLQIARTQSNDPRIRILAYNKLGKQGLKPAEKELMAIIVEIGLNEGLDVLAAFCNGTARYINHTGKLIVWEKTDDKSCNEISERLFTLGKDIVDKIGPWDNARRASPTKGNLRITFLVSDGLYFGEGPTDVLFNDSLAGPALSAATELMKYITEYSSKHTPH